MSTSQPIASTSAGKFLCSQLEPTRFNEKLTRTCHLETAPTPSPKEQAIAAYRKVSCHYLDWMDDEGSCSTSSVVAGSSMLIITVALTEIEGARGS